MESSVAIGTELSRLKGRPRRWHGTLRLHKRFFHWFLEFPEIIARGGFDCILGNPPYLGGQALSGTYGHPFCDYVKWEYAPAGLSDLVVYFVRRIFKLLKPDGFTAFITTNSIKDGDVRKDGLEQVLSEGGEINMAVRGIKWPGRANLVVSLVAIHNGAWKGRRSLDGLEVAMINAFFEDSAAGGTPDVLTDNANRMYQGSIFLGDGFLLSNEAAARLIEADPRNQDVIFPAPRGKEDINNAADQAPGRSIINFHDWSEERARSYRLPFEIVETQVKPFRGGQNRPRNRDVWWIYAEHRPGLTNAISSLHRCFVAARTTKYLNFSAVPTSYTFTDALNVFTGRCDIEYVLSSQLSAILRKGYPGDLTVASPARVPGRADRLCAVLTSVSSSQTDAVHTCIMILSIVPACRSNSPSTFHVPIGEPFQRASAC